MSVAASERFVGAPAPGARARELRVHCVSNLRVGNWLYELKFDGYRALAFKADKRDVAGLSEPQEFQ